MNDSKQPLVLDNCLIEVIEVIEGVVVGFLESTKKCLVGVATNRFFILSGSLYIAKYE